MEEIKMFFYRLWSNWTTTTYFVVYKIYIDESEHGNGNYYNSIGNIWKAGLPKKFLDDIKRDFAKDKNLDESQIFILITGIYKL
jgi:hypothetical protein